MAGRFRRSVYRLSSINRPFTYGDHNLAQDSAQYDGRRYSSTNKESSVEPRDRSQPLLPKRESVAASPTYSVKKVASPPSSPSYRASTGRVINSPSNPVDEHLNYKPTTQLRSFEAEPESMVYKAIEKVTKSDRHVESGKTTPSSHQHQPSAINIAGENLGAVMEIVESKREGGQLIKTKETLRRILNSKANDQYNEGSKDHKAEGQKTLSLQPASTFLNSNFQGVNNSLLYGASLAHRDPGLHLAFSPNPTSDRFTVDNKKQQQRGERLMMEN